MPTDDAFHDQAVRLVDEARARAPQLPLDTAVARVAKLLGMSADDVRERVVAEHPGANALSAPMPDVAGRNDVVPALPATRRRRRSRLAVVILASIAVVIAVAIVWSVVASIIDVSTKRELQQHGTRVAATVTSMRPSSCVGRGGCSPADLGYTFSTRDGARITVTESDVPNSVYNSVRVGGRMSVTYDPTDPRRNGPTAALTSFNPDTSRMITLVAAAGAFYLLTRLVHLLPWLGTGTSSGRAKRRQGRMSGCLGFVLWLVVWAIFLGVCFALGGLLNTVLEALFLG
ncbi:DUF3592 domain-containing protein [Humibacter albus]|uniref:DUF3592 domain-containing protein n=1 Tax=Humibacter albus TaxID=427754 RepID=UPI0003B4B847|nr:DUF3592 domain-containing protein [Humibacter albus]